MKGFSASFPAVCTQKGTPSQIDSEKECLEGFWNWDVRFTLYDKIPNFRTNFTA